MQVWGLQGQVQFLGLQGLKLLNSEQLAPLSLTPVGLTTLLSRLTSASAGYGRAGCRGRRSWHRRNSGGPGGWAPGGTGGDRDSEGWPGPTCRATVLTPSRSAPAQVNYLKKKISRPFLRHHEQITHLFPLCSFMFQGCTFPSPTRQVSYFIAKVPKCPGPTSTDGNQI